MQLQRGAQWFHGNTAANPVYTYATKTLKVPTVISDGNDVTFDGSSSASSAPLVDFETKRKWNALFNDFASELKDYYQQNWPKGRVTSSLGDALTSYATENDISGRDELALRERIDTNYVQEYAASPDKLSLWYFDADKKIAGEDAITNDGYNTVFNSIYDNLAAANAVRLGAAVTKVTRGSSGVQVRIVWSLSHSARMSSARFKQCLLHGSMQVCCIVHLTCKKAAQNNMVHSCRTFHAMRISQCICTTATLCGR